MKEALSQLSIEDSTHFMTAQPLAAMLGFVQFSSAFCLAAPTDTASSVVITLPSAV
ncbi:MAG: hypothetical protein ACXV8Q_00475 [Methylobacter sp.]